MVKLRTPQSLGRLVESQVRRWEALERGARARAAAQTTQPCIALSRLPGAGGSEVARRVAERLHYGVFDRELVDEIARDRGAERQLVAGLDERVRSGIDRYVTDYMGHRPELSERDYLESLVRIVKTLAQRGATVIVGRGAPFVLSEREALRVLLVAGRDFRLERFAASRGVPLEDATPLLEAEEARRGEFARRQFHVEQTDPQIYDLTLNTGTLGVELTADLVVTALRGRWTPTGPAAR